MFSTYRVYVQKKSVIMDAVCSTVILLGCEFFILKFFITMNEGCVVIKDWINIQRTYCIMKLVINLQDSDSHASSLIMISSIKHKWLFNPFHLCHIRVLHVLSTDFIICRRHKIMIHSSVDEIRTVIQQSVWNPYSDYDESTGFHPFRYRWQNSFSLPVRNWCRKALHSLVFHAS